MGAAQPDLEHRGVDRATCVLAGDHGRDPVSFVVGCIDRVLERLRGACGDDVIVQATISFGPEGPCVIWEICRPDGPALVRLAAAQTCREAVAIACAPARRRRRRA